MDEFLSLHDAEHIAEENAPVAHPGYAHVFLGMIRQPAATLAADQERHVVLRMRPAFAVLRAHQDAAVVQQVRVALGGVAQGAQGAQLQQ